jgi:hypothetical protein
MALVLGAGCVSATEVARASAVDRAASELGCARERVIVTPRPDLSHRTFDVNACGHAARYTCPVKGEGAFQSSARVDCIREPLESPGAARDSAP